MFRVLTASLFFLQICTAVSAQNERKGFQLKNGLLSSANSLLHQKISHAAWQSGRFEENYYVLVQMNEIADADQKSFLANHGIKLRQFLNSKTYLATCTPAFDINAASNMGIKNIFLIPAELKLSAALQNGSVKQGEKDLIAVSCFPLDKNLITRALREAGAEIVETKIKPANTWFVRGSATAIKKLASLPYVVSVNEIHLEDVPLNYNNHAVFGVNALATTIGRNLTGRNLVLGIGDNADPSTHIDLAGKLIMRTDEPVSDHGTHTSGTLAGGGILNPIYMGMAPKAHLVVNDFSNILINSPTYVADYQMPLTNNSYYNGSSGCGGDGDYNALSNYIDSQMLAYPKLLHVFAAGNDGGLTCSPYPINFATIKSGFQTGKNILTVGSMNNMNYLIGTGSSRGPLADGRIKPEIVTGGVVISSTLPFNNYGGMTGTSMASPTAAGILALITERYRQLHGGLYPDAALLKTLITNSADDLGNPGPDFTYGFGMINGRTTVEALEQNHYFNGTVTDKGTQQFTIPALPAGISQIKIMLYWPDAPALPMAATSLINDLDVQVSDPLGATHLPMILDPTPTGFNNNAVEGADHRNNIEQVLIKNPAAGDYTVTVNGFSVPSGPQSFYVAYEMIRPSVTLEYPFGGETWVPSNTEIIRWSAYGGEPNSFTLEYSTDGGSGWNLVDNAIPATARSYSWLVPNLVTTKALVRITRNTVGYTDVSDYPFTILNQPSLTVTPTCPGYAQLKWNGITGADSYDIMQFAGDSMKRIASTTDTSYLATPLNLNTTYWFAVRALQGGVPGRRSVAQPVLPNFGACTLPAIKNDLVMQAVLAPVSGRQFTVSQPGNQRIRLLVRNPGSAATVSPISFSFQVNGGTVVTEILGASIPANTNATYTFAPGNSYDFSAVGIYDVKTWLHYAGDTIPGNDTLYTRIKNLKNDPLILNPSFTESFESATDQAYTQSRFGLDSLDRADLSVSGSNGRLNTFFNTGFARTGKRSILLDVNEQGTNAADSLINTFNLSGYSGTDQIWLDLYFKKQSVVPALPGNQIWIRGNDQAAWIPVKSLADPTDLPGDYIKLNLDLTGILAGASPAQTISSSFQVRCGAEGKTPAASANPMALPGGGISFDDFSLTNALNDVGLQGLVQPSLKSICALGPAEKITVLIRNYGSSPLLNIPVTYVVNQDTVTELVPLLAPKDSLYYSFIKTEDMSAYQVYHIKAWVSNPTDNYHNNDSSRNYSVQTTPVISQFPYLEGFENNNGYWYSGGQNNSWQWGQPAKSIIHKAANGSKAWVTNLTGNYNDNEYSYLYSPCFDLTSLTKPVLSFSHIFQTEDDCNCDFHWVEYSVNDSVWTQLGNATSGVNWFDNAMMNAWQTSSPRWHVSSFDIPLTPPKIRFRIVMFSDPGTNYEGVGIDDIHIFEKAPVFADSLTTSISRPVSGSGWVDFDENGKRILSIQPNGQDLGNMQLTLFRDTASIRDTAGQYYGQRSWVLHTEKPAVSDLQVRYYYTDSEANKMILANSCISCLNVEDAYSIGITQYSSSKINEEDSTLKNNYKGNYLFHQPQKDIQVIPNDNGYYAETTVSGFSEFWMNGGGKNQDHPLAAWLKNFTAVLFNTTGKLSWTSWQETGSVKYVVERSADSISFAKIGEMPSFPHSDSVQSYIFNDQDLLPGNNYYRILLYFQSGDSLISPVRKLFYEPIPVSVQVFPNPTPGEITIKTPLSCREIQIFDVLGRKLMDRPGQGYIQQVSLASFSQGVYFLKLFTDSGNKLIKLEKR